MNSESKQLGDRIIGAWKMISCTYKNSAGVEADYFGPNPEGVLLYDASGIMSAQFRHAHRPLFSSDAIGEGTAEEVGRAFNSYQAYYGTYKEEAPGKVIHTVSGSIFPNWTGHDEVRFAVIKGDKLIISTPAIPVGEDEITFYVVWQRVSKRGDL